MSALTLKERAMKIDKIADKNVKKNRKIARKISNVLLKYSDWVMQDHIYKVVRKLTKPLHWLWIWGWMEQLKRAYEQDVFRKPGVYIIVGEPGSGKSSLAKEIMHRTLMRTGKGSYINTAIEVPKVDERTGQLYLHHPRYEITDFFANGKIVAYPNHYHYAALHIDEAHRIWQYRNNQTTLYMDTFGPFMDYAVGVRHFIGHIFVYTQMEKVDTQLMSLGADGNFLEVQVRKGFNYKYWMADGAFETTILGWDLTFFKLKSNGQGGWDRIELFTHFLERTFDLKDFNTFNLRDALKNVKFDNRFKPREVKIKWNKY